MWAHLVSQALQSPFRSFVVKIVTSSASQEQLARRMGRQCVVNAVLFTSQGIEYFAPANRHVGVWAYGRVAFFATLSLLSAAFSITWFRRAKPTLANAASWRAAAIARYRWSVTDGR